MANDFFTYVDNVWTKGANAEECWQSTRFAASKYNFLGLQDAARKRRGPSCDAGPWAGSTVLTSSGTVAVTVTPGHLQKTKGIIQWISDGIQSGAPMCQKPWRVIKVSLSILVEPTHTWHLQGTALLDNVESALSSLPRDAVNWGGDILCKLFHQARTLGSVSPSVAWEMLSGN